MLLRHLPPESATVRAETGHDWTLTHSLLANIADLLAGANWQRAGNAKADRPAAMPRPWIKPRGASAAVVARGLDEIRRRRGVVAGGN